MISSQATDTQPSTGELRALFQEIERMRSERIRELSELARARGGEVVKSELHAKCGSLCVHLDILPMGQEQPVFAFPTRNRAQEFIDSARDTGYLAIPGTYATTTELNFLGEGMRAAISLFRRTQR